VGASFGMVYADLNGINSSMPVVTISQKAGADIAAIGTEQTSSAGIVYRTGKLTVRSAPSGNYNDSAYKTMSSFSSFGVPGNLSLKPDITAPGGNIYSVNGAVRETDQYELMSGTSMASPQVAGLAAVAEPMIRLLLTDKWLPCVPFLQLCCIDYALYPIHTNNLSAINAKGRSDVFLKLEIIKKSYGLAILLISVLCFDGVMAIAWGGVISSAVSAAVNAHPNRSLIRYGFLEQLHDILPTILISLVMFGVVYAMNTLALPASVLLILQVIAGAAVYGGLSMLFKVESMQLIGQVAKKLFKR
jgi:O-antigen/teichoic acid export membrane protein